jgi:phosphoserine phosphatase
MVNDTEEALLLFQIETFSFRIPPSQFAAVLRSGVPAGPFASSFRNMAGHPVDRYAIVEDISDDYRELGRLPAARAASPLLVNFRAKLLFLYAAIDSSYGAHVAYPWVIYLLSGYTADEVKQLAAQSNARGLGSPLEEVTFTSSEEQPGKSGTVHTVHRRGLRVAEEVASLMHTLRRNGFEVFVVSASLEDVVAAFATLPKYGYNLPRDHVFGLRLAQEDGRLAARYLAGWPVLHRRGKVELIRRELVTRFGRGPALVFGDSDGDFNMLTEFEDTKAGLIVNRLKGGDIGSLCRKAIASHGKPNPRFLLQGRNDAIGLWQPAQSSWQLNAQEDRLLA